MPMKLADGSTRKTGRTFGPPACPSDIKGEARKEWLRVCTESPHINASHRGALAVYVVAWQRWREADLKVRGGGMVVKTKSGNVIPNPYGGVANTAQRIMIKAMIELGITPRSERAKAASFDVRLPA